MSNKESYKNIGLIAPDILLPKKSINMYKWATVACDQYTSQPDYWQDVEEITKNSPSTYNLMLPELYLEENDVDERIKKINEKSIEVEVAKGVVIEVNKNAVASVE